MRASWRRADFEQAATGHLGFTAQQGAEIRDYVSRKVSQDGAILPSGSRLVHQLHTDLKLKVNPVGPGVTVYVKQDNLVVVCWCEEDFARGIEWPAVQIRFPSNPSSVSMRLAGRRSCMHRGRS